MQTASAQKPAESSDPGPRGPHSGSARQGLGREQAASRAGAHRPGSVGNARQRLRTRDVQRGAALFKRYLRIHSPPVPRPQADTQASKATPASRTGWGPPQAPPLSPPLTACFGCDWSLVRCAPAYRKNRLGPGKRGRRRKADYKDALPFQPKSHVALHSPPVTTPLVKLS